METTCARGARAAAQSEAVEFRRALKQGEGDAGATAAGEGKGTSPSKSRQDSDLRAPIDAERRRPAKTRSSRESTRRTRATLPGWK